MSTSEPGPVLDQKARDLLGPEQDLGEDERGRSANAALRALARTSRSYLIYDPRNDAIRSFLEDVKKQFEHYANHHGDMDLQVRPFELALEGEEVVYLERDRERSLAFKLFRDGVRRLTIKKGVEWEEITQLLQILSIRYVGIRMQEDDILTLLWKAGFEHIELESIEGFVPEEDDYDGATGNALSSMGKNKRHDGEGGQLVAPHNFDLPLPELPQPQSFEYKEVDGEALAALCHEISSTQLTQHILNLTQELLRIAADPTDLLDFKTCRNFLREIRDFLMSESELAPLLTLFQMLSDFCENPRIDDEIVEAARGLMASFTNPGALRRLLASLPRSADEPPPDFQKLLSLCVTDPMPILVSILRDERVLHVRRFVTHLLGLYLPERADDLLTVYRASDGAVAADLLRALALGAPQAAQEAFLELIRTGDTEVKLEYLKLVERLPGSDHMRIYLVRLMNAPESEVRMRALEVIGRQASRGAFNSVFRHLEHCIKANESDTELALTSEMLARVDSRRALEVFARWSKPGKLFNRLSARHARLRRAAVPGLARIENVQAQSLLKGLTDDRDEELAAMARAALRQRAVEDPAGEDPAVEDPAGEDPAGEDPAETTSAPEATA